MAPRPRAKRPAADSELVKKRCKNVRASQARLRYHTQTEEEKEASNQRRRDRYHQKRQAEKDLLLKKAAQVADGDIEKISAIVARRQRKAEIERNRYAKMTPEKRDEMNKKRCAQIKKERQAKKAAKTADGIELVKVACEITLC